MIVIISDLHGDANTAGYPRFEDVENAALEAAEYAAKHKAEAFICAGDIITNDPSLDLMIRCVKSANKVNALAPGEKYWMSGNHDVFEDDQGTTAVDLIHGDRTYAVTAPCTSSLGIGFLPFTASSRNYDPAAQVLKWKKAGLDLRLIVGHLNIDGITPGSEIEKFPRGRNVFFPIDECKKFFPKAVLVNGHIHKRGVFNGVHIVGSLVNLTRGEVDNKPGFLAIDV